MDGVCTSTEACPTCRELRKTIQHLERRIEQLAARGEALCRGWQADRRKIRRLEGEVARLRLDRQLESVEAPATACNSSLPPSANPPRAPKPVVKKRTGRPSGGQVGHQGHGPAFRPTEQMDRVVRCRAAECSQCHARLSPSPAEQVVARWQQVEIRPSPVQWTEYQEIESACTACGAKTRGQIPPEVLKSICGPVLTAVIGFLTASALVSGRKVEQVLSVVLRTKLSLGSIFAREQELSRALEEPYEQLKQEVQAAAVKYVDETSWKRAAQWLWVAAAAKVVVFVCSSARNFGALRRLLGESLRGLICTDRYSVYGKCPSKQRGLCWAHLKRDFQRWVDRGGASAKLGREALAITGEVFERWRGFKGGRMGRPTLQRHLRPLQRKLKGLLNRGSACANRKTAGLCRRLLKLWGPMWRFASAEGLEPTNNLAERMLRLGVLWRKRSFGSHSRGGCRFVERLLSVSMTVELRGGNVVEYLASAIAARRAGRATPLVSAGK